MSLGGLGNCVLPRMRIALSLPTTISVYGVQIQKADKNYPLAWLLKCKPDVVLRALARQTPESIRPPC